MNNYWEDLNMSLDLKEKHNEIIEEMNIPNWALIKCPFCNKQLNHRSVRSVQLLFNARNIGDVAIEICCDDCKKMDNLYFKSAANNIQQFIDLLNGKDIEKEPLLEENMYKSNYNNLIEKIIEKGC